MVLPTLLIGMSCATWSPPLLFQQSDCRDRLGTRPTCALVPTRASETVARSLNIQQPTFTRQVWHTFGCAGWTRTDAGRSSRQGGGEEWTPVAVRTAG